MSEIRAILSWDEIRTIGTTNSWHKTEYTAAIKDFTRPITPDDVREMIRMPDEWAGKENQSFMEVVTDNLCGAEDIAIKFLDIALRPVPEPDHKPCPFCGGEATCEAVGSSGQMKEYYVTCSTCDCVIATHVTYFEAWAAWDRRKEDE